MKFFVKRHSGICAATLLFGLLFGSAAYSGTCNGSVLGTPSTACSDFAEISGNSTCGNIIVPNGTGEYMQCGSPEASATHVVVDSVVYVQCANSESCTLSSSLPSSSSGSASCTGSIITDQYVTGGDFAGLSSTLSGAQANCGTLVYYNGSSYTIASNNCGTHYATSGGLYYCPCNNGAANCSVAS